MKLRILVSLFDDLLIFDLEVIQVVVESPGGAIVMFQVCFRLMSRRHLTRTEVKRVGSLLCSRVLCWLNFELKTLLFSCILEFLGLLFQVYVLVVCNVVVQNRRYHLVFSVYLLNSLWIFYYFLSIVAFSAFVFTTSCSTYLLNYQTTEPFSFLCYTSKRLIK